MRSLALLAALLCGCGPAVGGDDPVDEDWMLGTFSNLRGLPGEDSLGGAYKRFELLPGGQGEVINVGCEEDSRPLSWSLGDEGAILVEFDVETTPTTISFVEPVCDDGVFAYHGEQVFKFSPEANGSVRSNVLYRSGVCTGAHIPGDDCFDDGNECDPRGRCTVVWCQGGEPEVCEE